MKVYGVNMLDESGFQGLRTVIATSKEEAMEAAEENRPGWKAQAVHDYLRDNSHIVSNFAKIKIRNMNHEEIIAWLEGDMR